MPKENWEVPITKSPLSINPASNFETQHTAVNGGDSCEVPMVSLVRMLRDSTPMGMRQLKWVRPTLLCSMWNGPNEWTPARPNAAGLAPAAPYHGWCIACALTRSHCVI